MEAPKVSNVSLAELLAAGVNLRIYQEPVEVRVNQPTGAKAVAKQVAVNAAGVACGIGLAAGVYAGGKALLGLLFSEE